MNKRVTYKMEWYQKYKKEKEQNEESGKIKEK